MQFYRLFIPVYSHSGEDQVQHLPSLFGILRIAIDLSGAGDNFDVDSAAGSVYLDGGEAAADAIKLDASATAGGIDIDAGTGGIAVDSDGTVSIDGADDMNFTLTTSTDAEDLTIEVDGDDNASIIITSDGTGTDAVKIETSAATGDIDINAGDIAEGTESVRSIGEQIFTEIIEVASGKLSRSEVLGHNEFAIHPIGPTV